MSTSFPAVNTKNVYFASPTHVDLIEAGSRAENFLFARMFGVFGLA